MDINMSEAGNFDNKTDENDDIYKDIGDFHFDRELVKLEECNKAYLEDIEKLSAKVKQLTERNAELQSVNDILATNISILLKTAKAEIQRKQLVIDEFRKKIEDTNKRNCPKGDDLKNVGVCKMCGSRFSQDNTNDLEDGEIRKNDSEEDDVKSEVGSHRNFKSRDKREHSGSYSRKRYSHERSRGRSNEKYSSYSRSSRRSEDRHSRHSRSSRSRPRYRSPDERRHYSRRRRSREKTSHSSDYVRKSSSLKREYIPRGKDVRQRSEERHRSRHSRVSSSCSKVNSLAPKSSTKSEKNSDSTESSSGLPNSSENKTNGFKSDSNVIKNRTVEKQNGKTENRTKEKSDVVKKSNKNDYHERKSGNTNGNNCAGKECENNLFTRQSVLADLYDETMFCSQIPDTKRFKNPEVVPQYINNPVYCIDSSSDESWTLSFGKKSEVLNKPRTLYSRRMEIRLKQKIKEDEMNKDSICGENNCVNQDKYVEENPVCADEEKEEGEITFDKDEEEEIPENAVQKEGVAENAEAAPIENENDQVQGKDFGNETCAEVDVEAENPEPAVTDKDSEQSFGENIIEKLLELQKEEGTLGIKEFSPLKNNYKLSKISPLKSVQKQHILEYYNLKPAQQLSNIDPEILDCSFSVPETPGKNFSNPFGALDSQELVRNNEDDKLETFEEEKHINNLNGKKVVEDSKGMDSNPVEVEETHAGSTKFEEDEKGASPEGKNLRVTRAKRKLRPDTAKVKQTDSTHDNPKNKKSKDPVTYQIRTRSRTENENRKCAREVNDQGEKKERTSRKNKSVAVKRKRGVISSEEEAEGKQEQKNRRETNSEAEIEISKSSNEEPIEPKGVENEKVFNESKTEDASKANDIAYFEVFQSLSEATNDIMVEDKNLLEELSLSNMSDCRATITPCSDTPNKLKCANESKLSLLSSGDSSTFKVLRSYLMLSANGESDVEAFSEDSTCSSGEYSDSGASAFVDLL